MKVFRNLITILTVSAVMALAISILGTKHTALAVTNPKPIPPTATTNDVVYKYVAQPGDSYSLIARKAVQTYGSKFKVKLSRAQIIYAETNLTQQAKSPLLDIDQKLSVSENTVKQWVNKATKLTASQKAAWNYYVQFADFNTNAVGQS